MHATCPLFKAIARGAKYERGGGCTNVVTNEFGNRGVDQSEVLRTAPCSPEQEDSGEKERKKATDKRFDKIKLVLKRCRDRGVLIPHGADQSEAVRTCLVLTEAEGFRGGTEMKGREYNTAFITEFMCNTKSKPQHRTPQSFGIGEFQKK